MYAWYDSQGVIQRIMPASAKLSTDPAGPANTTCGFFDDTEYPDLFAHAHWYFILNGVPVLQPHFSASCTNGTLTVTLQDPPTTNAPTTATLTVGTSTVTIPLTNNTATISLAPDANVAGQLIQVGVSAPGCVGYTLTVQNGMTPVGPLQILAPASGQTTYRIAWASAEVIMGASAAALNQAELYNMLGVFVGEVFHLLHDKVLPALTATTYTPITLSADEQNALDDITTILGSITFILSTLYPQGGSPAPVYAHAKAAIAAVQKAMADANAALTHTPNLL